MCDPRPAIGEVVCAAYAAVRRAAGSYSAWHKLAYPDDTTYFNVTDALAAAEGVPDATRVTYENTE